MNHKNKRYVIGIDVGGTNTDAVLLVNNQLTAAVKQLTSDDIISGICNAMTALITENDINPANIHHINIGTTYLLNAITQRQLNKVLALRLAAPATTALDIAAGWHDEMKQLIVAESQQIVSGGYEYNGVEIAPLNESEIQQAIKQAKQQGINAVAITGVFSHLKNDQELMAARLMQDNGLQASLSHQLGGLGLYNRENSTIINASLSEAFSHLKDALLNSKKQLQLQHSKIFLINGCGTVQEVSESSINHIMPILTLHSGPTNSMRGACAVSNSSDAIVVDIGGTTTDIGLLKNGSPVIENVASEIAIGTNITCQIMRPRTFSVGLGGGTIITIDDKGDLQLSDKSLEHNLHRDAICFGGDIITCTDIAIIKQQHTFATKDATETFQAIQQQLQAFTHHDTDSIQQQIDSIYNAMHDRLLQLISNTVTSQPNTATTLLLIGGGALLFREKTLLSHMQQHKLPINKIKCLDNAGVINAIGAAMAKCGIQEKTIIDYATHPRNEAIIIALRNAVKQLHYYDIATDSIDIAPGGFIETPITYMPGHHNELSIQLIADYAESRDKSTYDIETTVKRLADNIGIKPNVNTKTIATNPDKQQPTCTAIKHTTAPTNKSRTKRNYQQQQPLTQTDIDNISLGACYLGSGGGGTPLLGNMIAKRLLDEGYSINMIDTQHLDDECLVVATGLMGSPTILYERLPAKDECLRAINAIEESCGQHIDAVIPMEIGGCNGTYPLAIAAQLAIPVLDADYMGRAFPGIHMVTPCIHQNNIKSPLSLANHSSCATLTANVLTELEQQARWQTIEKGCAVSIAYLPMPAKWVKQQCITNSISIARAIGECMQKQHNSIDMRLQQLADTLQATPYHDIKVITQGRIRQVKHQERHGFSIGGFIINNEVLVGFQNENLFAISLDEPSKPLAILPNIITVIDANTAKPIPCEELCYGQEVLVISLSTPDILSSSAAETVLGQSQFPFAEICELFALSAVS